MASAASANEWDAYVAPYAFSLDPKHRSAEWLVCSFDAHIWLIRCGDTTIELDWRIRLDDGNLLTDSVHAQLWEDLRRWIVLQGSVEMTGGRIYAPGTLRNAIQRVVYCIDYLLLRSASLGLSRFGMTGLSKNDLKAMIATLATSRSPSRSVYEWHPRVRAYLRDKLASTPSADLAQAVRNAPFLALDLPRAEERRIFESDDELINARAWLWLNNGYTKGAGADDEGHAYSAHLGRLAADIYSRTLWGTQVRWSALSEFGLLPGKAFRTEYPRARVHGERDERMDAKWLRHHARTISSLQLLERDDLPSIDEHELLSVAHEVKDGGRFRTLPHSVVFYALRRAIEFVLEHGDSLVDSLLAIAAAARASNQRIAAYSLSHSLLNSLKGSTPLLGVEQWTIEPVGNGRNPTSLSKTEYFESLRSNKGLYESFRVLCGASQLIVGSLMAQRCGALVGLQATKCLDSSETQLIFENAKSGHSGYKRLERRPIPSIAVTALKQLERFQLGLVELGIIESTSAIFAFPAMYGEDRLITFTKARFSESFDYFCDWAEIPLDPDGRRYYIRQHQLRRFFAMLFFWGGGFGGMDTLRWFLGHSDVQHLWHYITESTPGAVLRSVAAEWVAYSVTHSTDEATVLGELLVEKFGTSNFVILDEDVLQNYLEDLLEEGRLVVEPQFLDGKNAYRIAVHVKEPTGVEA